MEVLRFDEGRLEIDTVKHAVLRDGRPVDLTPNEYKLLLALASYPGRAYSRFELVNRVQGYDYDGDERTIDVHVKNLRKKIEPDPARPRYVETVTGVGLPAGEAVSGRRRRWGLRARLVLAFVAVALLGTAITTIYSSVSLTSHLEDSARARLHNSAVHFGDVAAVVSERRRAGTSRRSRRCTTSPSSSSSPWTCTTRPGRARPLPPAVGARAGRTRPPPRRSWSADGRSAP